MFKNLIYKVLISNFPRKSPVNKVAKVIILNSVALLSIFVFTFFAIISFKNNAPNISYILIGMTITVVINYIILYKTKNINIASYITLSIIGLIFIYLLFDGGKFGYGYIWFPIFPIISLLLLGLKQGLKFSIAFLLILIIIFFFLPQNYILKEYNYPLRIRIIIMYIAMLSIAFVYEFVFYKINKFNKINKEKEYDYLYKKEFIEQLSNEIKNISDNIYGLSNILDKKITENDSNKELFYALKTSSTNLISVINNLIEISDFEKYDKLNFINFNLQNSIKNIINLFNDNNIKVQINNNLPNVLNGNPFIIKHIIYKSILSLLKNKITPDINIKLLIDIIEFKNNKYNIKFNIISNKQIYILHKGKNLIKKHDKIISLNNEELKKIELLDIKKYLLSINNHFDVSIIDNTSKISFNFIFNKLDTKENYIKEIIFSQTNKYKNNFYFSKSILIIDDNLINQKLLAKNIENHVKSIDFASNEKETLKKYEINSYDLIFLNINSSKYNSKKIVKKIREIEFGLNTHIPIIAITTNINKKNKHIFIETGIDNFIIKPFNKSNITDILKQYLTN